MTFNGRTVGVGSSANPSCGISAEMHQPCGTNSPDYRCFRPTTDGGISAGIRDAGRHRWASCALGKSGATTRQMAIQGAGGASKLLRHFGGDGRLVVADVGGKTGKAVAQQTYIAGHHALSVSAVRPPGRCRSVLV